MAKKSTVNKAGNYTKPGMRKKIFNRIKAQASHGTGAGKWSARKAQALAKAYKKAGGRSITEIMKSGVRGAGKRKDAKDDLKYGIKMHGSGKLTKQDLSKLR